MVVAGCAFLGGIIGINTTLTDAWPGISCCRSSFSVLQSSELVRIKLLGCLFFACGNFGRQSLQLRIKAWAGQGLVGHRHLNFLP